ncbi:unnamed protein product [Adineta ricciae]|nr:unnamed protein product [Adineta ricciae]CAF0975701.1 unnamed protein product [Adineta ricciae]
MTNETFRQLSDLIMNKTIVRHKWKFYDSFYFSTVVLALIGYGHRTLITSRAKIFCIFYAMLGIPMWLITFQSTGERINSLLSYLLARLKRLLHMKQTRITDGELLVMEFLLSIVILVVGACVFSKYEKWSFFDSFYYGFITLTTIGFGDFVVLQGNHRNKNFVYNAEYFFFCMAFIFLGLTILASSMNLLVIRIVAFYSQERLLEKLRQEEAANQAVLLKGDVICSTNTGKPRPLTPVMPEMTASQQQQQQLLLNSSQTSICSCTCMEAFGEWRQTRKKRAKWKQQRSKRNRIAKISDSNSSLDAIYMMRRYLTMCGIWCIFGSTVDTHQQIPGCFNIAHRGPDCFRFENVNHFSRCVFGFHRLAIVDDIYGMQPMRIHALPHIWMTYNGEIYNFRQTQKKFGYEFETSCDGEILIHLYNDKGARFMCEQLYGVFAFVLFDAKERKVFVGRDTFGVRPSFRIFTDCGFLAVSSEAKGLEGVTVASKTALKITPLEPGTYEEYKLDENEKVEFVKKERFHSIGNFPKYDVNVTVTDDISSNIRSYLINAVRMRLMSHRRIGCMLSGGLDSSLIAALTVQEARKQGITYPIQTFSIGMDESSPDLVAARKVAQHLGTEHHEIRFTSQDAIDHLRKVIRALESYDITTIRASIGMYFVSKYIQEKTDTVVILSGEGADEVCQGYIYFYRQPTPEEGDQESRRLCNDLFYYDVLRADRTTAAHGLELRVPFLDHAFTSYYFSLPAKERMPTKERAEKYILRKAFDGLNLIPQEILWRPKEAFSDGVAAKKKSLFEYMQEYAETKVSDSDLQQASTLYPFNTPKTKESFLYRSIFEEFFPGHEHLTPYMWLPKWCGEQTDPSARVLKHYKEQQGDEQKSHG